MVLPIFKEKTGTIKFTSMKTQNIFKIDPH